MVEDKKIVMSRRDALRRVLEELRPADMKEAPTISQNSSEMVKGN